jgi:ankyrin repeat protein
MSELTDAIRKNDLDKIKQLFTDGFNINNENDENKTIGLTYLMEASYHGFIEIINFFLDNGVAQQHLTPWCLVLTYTTKIVMVIRY